MTTRADAFDLEAVYQGLDAAEAGCRREWPALLDAIAKARAVADALRGEADACQALPLPSRPGALIPVVVGAPLFALKD